VRLRMLFPKSVSAAHSCNGFRGMRSDESSPGGSPAPQQVNVPINRYRTPHAVHALSLLAGQDRKRILRLPVGLLRQQELIVNCPLSREARQLPGPTTCGLASGTLPIAKPSAPVPVRPQSLDDALRDAHQPRETRHVLVIHSRRHLRPKLRSRHRQHLFWASLSRPNSSIGRMLFRLQHLGSSGTRLWHGSSLCIVASQSASCPYLAICACGGRELLPQPPWMPASDPHSHYPPTWPSN
jgi:hypothetical protein